MRWTKIKISNVDKKRKSFETVWLQIARIIGGGKAKQSKKKKKITENEERVRINMIRITIMQATEVNDGGRRKKEL